MQSIKYINSLRSFQTKIENQGPVVKTLYFVGLGM